ncbi:hypothetical protein HNQ02_002194 [Flavobacterium sp. 7E]|uniref:hypothetical protein n=1 Tax=Flavobacterium sp. 7E TaxID=2735898 RepID=UPI00156D6BEC|nr:hypothetical protein [Flavobacterium sp. 7E]NRS89268.1 hypothetical protein [Flavobacterium sp. 7E]
MKTKIFKSVVVLTMILFAFSCENDAMDGLVREDRQIVSFKLNGQVGPAIITPIGDDEGVVEIFAVMAGIDLNAVLPSVEISEKATISPNPNESANFNTNGGSFVYTITSESGKTRKWKVNLKPFVSEIDGDWGVTSFKFDWFIGKGESWGWGENNADLTAALSDAGLEKDNTLGLVTTLVNESGNPEGTFDFGSGADMEYARFIVNPDHAGQVKDYSSRFRKMPIGKGVFEYNVAGKVLTLWRGNKSGISIDGKVTKSASGAISIAFDNWVNEFTWDHWGAESQIQNSYTIYYNFVSL